MGGAGVNYNLGNNVRLNLDVMYRYGMSNIVSTKNRYDSDRLSGVGDVMDDLTLDNLSISLGCLFPLRFLSSGFKTLDLNESGYEKKLYILVLFIAGFAFASCSEESNPEFDTDNFTTIFDNNKFDASYFPIDMRQTPDGGYLILGGRKLNESNFTGIYLLKADKFGNFVKEIEVDETSVNPIAKLTEYQTKYYFFCMDPITQEAQIADVDADLAAVTITPVQGGLTYPAAAIIC